jgi:ABC-2 type transport system permease protein
MNRFAWLMRREVWEHRAIWAAPLVVLALLLLGALAGNILETQIHINTGPDGGEVTVPAEGEAAHSGVTVVVPGDRKAVGPGEALASVSAEERIGVLAIAYAAVSAVMFMVLGTIGFFYALDTLYADRRDRSVLFWKSLPLSDLETVLAKFCVAAVAIPLVAAVAAIAGQLIVAVGGSIKLELTGGAGGVMWMPSVLGGGALASVLLAIVCALWYAPVTAYLLLASAWAPRSPFLWAVLPPVALSMLEKLAFGSNMVVTFLKQRMFAPVTALLDDDRVGDGPVGAFDIAANISDLTTSPGMVLGLVAAAALLAGVIWVRRYRDETL